MEITYNEVGLILEYESGSCIFKCSVVKGSVCHDPEGIAFKLWFVVCHMP